MQTENQTLFKNPPGLQWQVETAEKSSWTESLPDSWPFQRVIAIVGLPGPHPVSQPNNPLLIYLFISSDMYLQKAHIIYYIILKMSKMKHGGIIEFVCGHVASTDRVSLRFLALATKLSFQSLTYALFRLLGHNMRLSEDLRSLLGLASSAF